MFNSSHKGASAYRSVGLETRAQTHDQYELVLMMFETVLESLARARGAIEAGDTPTKLEHIDKVIRIIQEGLRTSLDLENGGELAANLAALYDYSVLRTTQANAANSVPMLHEVTGLLKPVAEAWKQMRNGQAAGESTTGEPSQSAGAPSAEKAGENGASLGAGKVAEKATPARPANPAARAYVGQAYGKPQVLAGV